jgi:hypothetical protein
MLLPPGRGKTPVAPAAYKHGCRGDRGTQLSVFNTPKRSTA